MDSPLLTRAGAVPAEGTDAGVAAHYGDPYAEQRALTRDAGLVDRSNRGILRITGADRLATAEDRTMRLVPKESTHRQYARRDGG